MIRWIHKPHADNLLTEGSVVSVGSFDGVHLGHRAVLEAMKVAAAPTGAASLVASFDPHPRAVLHGVVEERLTTITERSSLLSSLGVDAFVTLEFDRSVASMTARAFVEEVLVGQLKARVVVVGHDHRFGRKREGNTALLKAWGPELGYEVLEIPAHVVGDTPVSSSRIRSAVRSGGVAEASSLLGYAYSLSGTVVKGAGRGRKIGVPTANLELADPLKLTPHTGVYAVRTHVPESSSWLPGMMNIGSRPTFDGHGRHLEVNIIDWSGDLYGDEVRVEFVERIRDEVKFDGAESLIRQLNQDRDRCRGLLQGVP